MPLINLETVVQLIGNTKTTKGLEIQAQIDNGVYKKGLKVIDEDFDSIAIIEDRFRGEWNDIIHPVAVFEVEH